MTICYDNRNSFRLKIVECFMLAIYFVFFFGVIVSDVIFFIRVFSVSGGASRAALFGFNISIRSVRFQEHKCQEKENKSKKTQRHPLI